MRRFAYIIVLMLIVALISPIIPTAHAQTVQCWQYSMPHWAGFSNPWYSAAENSSIWMAESNVSGATIEFRHSGLTSPTDTGFYWYALPSDTNADYLFGGYDAVLTWDTVYTIPDTPDMAYFGAGAVSSTDWPEAVMIWCFTRPLDGHAGTETLLGAPTPTPTETPTPSNTPTNTPTPSNTPVPSETPTSTPTEVPSATSDIPTDTPTNTPVVSATPSPSDTPTATGSPLPTNTPTTTAVPVVSATPTITAIPAVALGLTNVLSVTAQLGSAQQVAWLPSSETGPLFLTLLTLVLVLWVVLLVRSFWLNRGL